MRAIMLGFALSTFALGAAFAEEILPGTYKLISSTRTIVETGEVKDAFGKHPNGRGSGGKKPGETQFEISKQRWIAHKPGVRWTSIP